MELVEGKLYEVVVKEIINKVGVVVLFEDDDTALVHISNIADAYVKNIRDYVDINETLIARCQEGKVKPLELTFLNLHLPNRNETRDADRYIPKRHDYISPLDHASRGYNRDKEFRPASRSFDRSRHEKQRKETSRSIPHRRPSMSLDEMIEQSNKDYAERTKPSKNRRNKRR